MSHSHPPDWDPKSTDVMRDQRAAGDLMRRRCPVAYSEFMGWSLFRHEDVTRALHDHDTFSNAVSQHLSVPNGMDPPEHSAYRRLIEPYFSPERMAAFEPVCRDIAVELMRDLSSRGEVEFMADAARSFAEQVQCAFLGWPPELQESLARWTRKNRDATLAQDRKAMSEVALEFEEMIDNLLEARLQAGADPETDLTASLMHERVNGRPLSNEEVASILRNWTVGEIGTISAAAGILVQYLAGHPELQGHLRSRPDLLPPAIEEILRIHGPLVANRRITTRAVEIGGRTIEAGERISLNWLAANRDERAFDDPDAFRTDRDPGRNLLYGAGIHFCPGAPLARLELRVLMEEVLARTGDIATVPEKPATLAAYPASGFAALPLRIR
ncbi:MAG: cytochrome P450 [Acidobacteria bacterium]|nr:cytochrome P450 [Acidobacteriota bacterium]